MKLHVFPPSPRAAKVLALASPDASRFRAGVGTVYLVRLAELASMATARYLPLG